MEESESEPLIPRSSGAGRSASQSGGRLRAWACGFTLLLLLLIFGLRSGGPQRQSLAAWTPLQPAPAAAELADQVMQLRGRVSELEREYSARLLSTQAHISRLKQALRTSSEPQMHSLASEPMLKASAAKASEGGSFSQQRRAAVAAQPEPPSEPPTALGLSPQCTAEWETGWGRTVPPGSSAPKWHIGGDLEQPGVLEETLAARAPDRELIFLSVGDTRDHRRVTKDPQLKTISTDFLINLLANLHALKRDHYVILSTKSLCAKLQQDYCVYSCVWSSLWDEHPGLSPWNLKPGDMFLMWAQQWYYISRAMALGYRVLRADTDVYFAEDPYPLFDSPLFRPFEMLVQHDFEGKARPQCSTSPHASPNSTRFVAPGLSTCGSRHYSSALLNIGLVYLRSQPGGGVFAVINGTWAKFVTKLSGEPYRPAHLGGKVESQALIDQPFMRQIANELAVSDQTAHPKKAQSHWSVVPGDAASAYPAGAHCSPAARARAEVGLARACASVAAARARSAFLAQLVRPRREHTGGVGQPVARDERIALAPDWLFGRGCLTQLENPLALARAAKPGWQPRGGGSSCSRASSVSPAPGPTAGVLVATHFVYSMALKRKRAFRAFGWDMGAQRNRSARAQRPEASCWSRSKRGMLFGHTFFADSHETGAILCAMPSHAQEPECSCCTSLPSVGAESAAQARKAGFALETTGGRPIRLNGHFEALKGCNDYQLFWD